MVDQRENDRLSGYTHPNENKGKPKKDCCKSDPSVYSMIHLR
jgi:hypothetical protein